jgi:drug/metabolite transporter (DMT)-like permease
MNSKLIVLLLLCGSLTTYAIGEYLSKVWTEKPSWWLGFTVAFVYSLGVAAWLPALKIHGQLFALSTVWSCAYVVIGILVGLIAFHETPTTTQTIGLILAIIASILAY